MREDVKMAKKSESTVETQEVVKSRNKVQRKEDYHQENDCKKEQ